MKTAGGIKIDWISLDPQGCTPLFQQLGDALRQAILSGQLPSGTRLPSSRSLAQSNGVSRNTVSSVYEQLVAEGYLESQTGSGTRVVNELPDKQLHFKPLQHPQEPRVERQTAPAAPPKTSKLLSPSLPAADAFPHELWRKLGNEVYRREDPVAWMDYGDPAGYWPLRQAISDYLTSSRGLQCSPSRVLIVSGAQQALDLVSRLLLSEKDTVWLEDPCYTGARSVFERSGAKLLGVPVDESGMNVEWAKAQAPGARLAFVTPSHQYPLGAVLSLKRRLQLLDWAQSNKAWIVEDDYGGEYRYAGRPLMALQGLDTEQRVIYTGTFSKVLYPALRLGYVVLPESLVQSFCEAKALMDGFAPVYAQMQLCEFIQRGHFNAHIRKMRLLYAQRQQTLLTALSPLSGLLSAEGCESGMHLVARLPAERRDVEISTKLTSLGLRVPALSRHYLSANKQQGLLLGFAGTSQEDIVGACKLLSRGLGGGVS